MREAVKVVACIGMLAAALVVLLACMGEKEDSVTYTVQCSRRIAGAERHVRVSDDTIVSWTGDSENAPLKGDGMASELDSLTFTGTAPGTVDVQVYDVLSWANREQDVDTFRLVVDEELDVERVEAVVAKRFELRETGTMAGSKVYQGEPSEAGFMKVSTFWETFDGARIDERSLNISPNEAWGAFIDNHVLAWDGFSESNDGVLDGYSFSFSAELSDGSRIGASGSNACPDGYAGFKRSIGSFLGEAG